jgi:hypothetical protein
MCQPLLAQLPDNGEEAEPSRMPISRDTGSDKRWRSTAIQASAFFLAVASRSSL